MKTAIAIVVSFSVWAVPLGVEAELWDITPVTGRAVFVGLLAAWAWAAWALANEVIKWALARKWRVTRLLSMVLQGGMPILAVILGFNAFVLRPLTPANCAPAWDWLPNIHFAKDKNTGRPFMIHFANVIPTTSKKYIMEIVAHGNDLMGLAVKWKDRGEEKSSRPFEQPGSAIGAVATFPTGRVSVILVGTAGVPESEAFNNLHVDNPTFKCLENGTR